MVLLTTGNSLLFRANEELFTKFRRQRKSCLPTFSLTVDFGDPHGGKPREPLFHSSFLFILNISIHSEYYPHTKCVHRIPNPYIPTYPTPSPR